MRNQVLNKLKTILTGFVIIVFLNQCNGQSKELKDCKLSYKNARTNFNAYYKKNEHSLLQKSLSDVEQAMKCKETRHQAIDLKISLLILLEKYKSGYEFIDSLSENDFRASYKKKMNYYYFYALDYESKGDTLSRNQFFNEIIIDIQDYIERDSMPYDNLKQEAYYDLFTVKRKVINVQQINAEIDLLKKKYPKEKDFFDSLKESLIEEPKVVSPLPPIKN